MNENATETAKNIIAACSIGPELDEHMLAEKITAAMNMEFRKGLKEAHQILCDMHDRLEREHHSLAPGLFGPTRRHHEIMGATRAILAAATEVLAEMRIAAMGSEEA